MTMFAKGQREKEREEGGGIPFDRSRIQITGLKATGEGHSTDPVYRHRLKRKGREEQSTRTVQHIKTFKQA